MKRRVVFTFFGLCFLLMVFIGSGAAQQFTCLAELATGEGTLEADNGNRVNIKAVAVFLQEDGEAEVCLMTSRENVYASGRWSRGVDAGRVIDLEITNDSTGGCVSGTGKVFLQTGCVPIGRVTMSFFRSDGTKFNVDFVEKRSRPCRNP